jgi:hypothetical protein
VYRVAGTTVTHDVLMRAAAAGARPAYPGFSEDPLESFRHLRSDLERFGEVFLRGSDPGFAEQAKAGELLAAERRGFRALS